MPSHKYQFPVAPISLNHSHIDTRRGPRIPKPGTLMFKDLVQRQMRFQDRKRGKPKFLDQPLRCTWTFSYPEENFFVEAAARSRRGRFSKKDSVFQPRDVSNHVKVIEDAAFEYLGVPDERVVDLVVRKRAVQKLQVPYLHYDLTEDNLIAGNVTLVVEPVNMLTEGPIIVGKWSGAVGGDLPSWFMPDYPCAEDPLWFGEDHEHWKSLIDRGLEDDALRFRVAMLNHRVHWLARILGIAVRDLVTQVFVPRLTTLRRKYKLKGGDPLFWWRPEWLCEYLYRECSHHGLARYGTLQSLPAGRVLVTPGRVGSWAVPFIRSGSEVTVVESDLPAVHNLNTSHSYLSVLRERFQGEQFTLVPEIPKKSYDVIVCLDWLDLQLDPLRALRQLVDRLSPGGVLVLSYTFKSKSAGESYPWVVTTPIELQDRRKRVQDFLTRKKDGLGLNMCDASSFREDLRMLCKGS